MILHVYVCLRWSTHEMWKLGTKMVWKWVDFEPKLHSSRDVKLSHVLLLPGEATMIGSPHRPYFFSQFLDSVGPKSPIWTVQSIHKINHNQRTSLSLLIRLRFWDIGKKTPEKKWSFCESVGPVFMIRTVQTLWKANYDHRTTFHILIHYRLWDMCKKVQPLDYLLFLYGVFTYVEPSLVFCCFLSMWDP